PETPIRANNAKTFSHLPRSVNRQPGERTRRERTLFDIDLKRQLHEDKLKSSGRYPGFQPGYSRETAREMERTFEGALSFQPSNTVPIVNGEPSAAPPSPLNEERAGERGEA